MTHPAALAALAVLLAPAVRAAPPDLRLAVPGLARDALEDAAGARVRCQSLHRLVNEESERWARLHGGAMAPDAYQDAHLAAGEAWAVARGECSKAQQAIPVPVVRAVLEEEVRRVDAVWNLQHRAAEAVREGRPRPQLSALAVDAGRAAERARAWILDSAPFWAGGAVPKEGSGGCGLPAWVAVEEAATAFRRHSFLTREEQAGDRARVDASVEGARASITACAAGADADRIDLHAAATRLALVEEALRRLRAGEDAGAALAGEPALLQAWATCRQRWRRKGDLGPGCGG